MNKLHKEIEYLGNVISERKEQGFFYTKNYNLLNIVVEYQQISSINKLNKAFDLLFEEMQKNNFL